MPDISARDLNFMQEKEAQWLDKMLLCYPWIVSITGKAFQKRQCTQTFYKKHLVNSLRWVFHATVSMFQRIIHSFYGLKNTCCNPASTMHLTEWKCSYTNQQQATVEDHKRKIPSWCLHLMGQLEIKKVDPSSSPFMAKLIESTSAALPPKKQSYSLQVKRV